MNITKVALSLGITMGLAACGGGPSKDEARTGYALAAGLATGLAPIARSQMGAALRSTATVPGTFCPAGGDVSFTGTGNGSSYDLTFAFNSCNLGAAVFDGSWHFTGDATTTKIVGGVSLEGQNFGFSCDFDLSVTGQAISGTACGYTVAELNATGG